MIVVYQLLVVAVIILGIHAGIRKGITGQIDALLGLGFGITASRILTPGLSTTIGGILPASQSPSPGYLPEALASMLIFLLFFGAMACAGPLMRKLLAPLGKGAINIIAGVTVGIMKYVVILSLIYNVVIGLDPGSVLLKSAEGDDGNLAEGILLLAPALTGTDNFEDLLHAAQMREAAKIS